MRFTRVSIFIALLVAIVAVFSVTAAEAQSNNTEPPADRQMFAELAGRDKLLFDSVFNTCNLDKLVELVA